MSLKYIYLGEEKAGWELGKEEQDKLGFETCKKMYKDTPFMISGLHMYNW